MGSAGDADDLDATGDAPGDAAGDGIDDGIGDGIDDGIGDVVFVPPPGGPGRLAFGLAFAAVLLGGVLGALAGFGIVDTGCDGACATPRAAGTLVGALLGGLGVGVVAVIVLRARSHWRVPHEVGVNRRT